MTYIKVDAVDSAEAIDREAWCRLAPPGDPFLNASFLPILERHGAAGRRHGWRPHHLVAKDRDGRTVGVLPLYFKSNSHGEFIYDWSWAGAYRQLGREYYPKLFTGLPHTPAAGPRLLAAEGPDRDAVRRSLVDCAQAMVKEYGLSSWHVAFPADADAALLQGAGLMVSDDVQFHWQAPGFGDFDGYLAAFSAEKRRKVRAERRRVKDSGLAIETLHGDQVAPSEWPALHALYAATFEKFGNYPAFSAACFAELAPALGDRMVIFVARERGEPVAVSICFRSDEALYGRYWGSRGEYHSLHFELCLYRGIDYCLQAGLRRFEPGAGGEHKIGRGFVPTVVRSCHWIADPAIRRLISQHLVRQRAAIVEYRDEAATHLPFRADAKAP
ncbi:MAG TPA: GNAT family N-acetyltransferase [Rhodocyclaceae bacterium]|nr:GNAT family N-acetyltransferase [Rhodocyclaceae bacterium]